MNYLPAAGLLAVVLLCTPASAGLIEMHFPDKSAEEIAVEFEQGLPEFLKARLGERNKPRIRIAERRDELFLELTGVEGDESTWQTLVPYAWYEDLTKFAYRPHGETYTYKSLELPPGQIAGCFITAVCRPSQVVSLAVWLAGKGELTLANRKLAELAEANTGLREDIENWLCGKYGWDRPEDGLTVVSHVDIRTDETVTMLLTGKELDEYHENRDDVAEELHEFIEDHSGGTKGKPGFRRDSPKVRLVVLKRWIESYRKSFMDTKYLQKKRNMKKLEELEEAINADLEFVETEKFKAERKGIDGDWPAAAEFYDILFRADPKNPELASEAAAAWSRAADISDAGRKCENPGAAKRAAQLYEAASDIYPLMLGYRNYAGLNWLAAGDKRRARAHHEYVLGATDHEDLSESEKSNREYAKRQLERIG